MSISKISSFNSINSINSRDRYNIYSKLSSGKRINKAADDAAGLAIAQKMLKRETVFSLAHKMLRTAWEP